MFRWRGSNQENGLQTRRQGAVPEAGVNKQAVCYDGPVDHPFRRAFAPIDLTPRATRATRDPQNRLRRVALRRLHRFSPEPEPGMAS